MWRGERIDGMSVCVSKWVRIHVREVRRSEEQVNLFKFHYEKRDNP